MGRATDNETVDDAPTVREPAGKVEIDSHGNSIWRWAREVLENTSVLLKRLENKDLALEPTQKVPVMRGVDRAAKSPSPRKGATAPESAAKHPAAPAGRRDGGGSGGFDPYNSR